MKNEARFLKLNEKKWDKWAKTYDNKGLITDQLRRTQDSLLSILDLRENTSFLDIGCGTGRAVAEASKIAGGKGKFYGVDLSPKMIEKAKENFQGEDNIHFIIANVDSIPLDDNFFDIIICTNSFHHYLHPEKAINEMYRLLKKAGKLYILDPVADNWLIKFIDKFIKIIEPEHVKIYSTEEFKQLFNNAGLKYCESKTIISQAKIQIAEK